MEDHEISADLTPQKDSEQAVIIPPKQLSFFYLLDAPEKPIE